MIWSALNLPCKATIWQRLYLVGENQLRRIFLCQCGRVFHHTGGTLGWDSYGDTQYVSHVLRYYPYGRAFTSGGNQAIVEVALTQLGNEGGQPYWSWYGFDSRVEWCACFVSWCADQCGYLESGIIPKYSLCSDGVDWFKGNGQWQDKNYEPSAGTIIFSIGTVTVNRPYRHCGEMRKRNSLYR